MTAARALTIGIISLLVACTGQSPEPQILPNVLEMAEERINAEDAIDVTYSFAALREDETERRIEMASAAKRVAHEARRALSILYYPVDLSSQQTIAEDAGFRVQLRAFESALLAQLQATAPESVEWVGVDGRLTWFELRQLSRIATLATTTPLLGPVSSQDTPHIFFFELPGFESVTARGTWRLDGERIAAPINFAEVDCRRSERVCRVTTLDVFGPAVGAGYSYMPVSYYQFMTPTGADLYEITRWANGIVEARTIPNSFGPTCRLSTLTIHQRDQRVTTVTQNGDASCPPLERPRVASLQSSERAVAQHFLELFEYVEQFHGPLARGNYMRPYVGALNAQ